MNVRVRSLNDEYRLPFASSICVQRGAPVDEGIAFALAESCSRFYIECSYEDRPQSWSDERIKRYVRRVAELALRPIVHGNYKLPVSHESASVRRGAVEGVKAEVDLAAEFGAPLIVHGSAIFTHRNAKLAREQALAAFTESVAELADYAAPKGVELWLENLEYYRDRHPFYTVFSCESDYAYVFERTAQQNVKFILDVGHENVGSGNPAHVFQRFSDRIVALDLNDNEGSKDVHLPLGRGKVDFESLLRVAIRTNWSGHLTFETRGGELSDDLAFLSRSYTAVVEQAAAHV